MLELMYITNDADVALIAEKYGVQRIWIDLETLGKEERQKNIDCVKSNHSINDIQIISNVLSNAELMVRINPWNSNSETEIEKVISAGAQRIMLPMWKSPEETSKFLSTVNLRVNTTLLLETKEAVECLDDVLGNPLLDEIHIGLNDLHLSYGLTFMFELLTNGTVEMLCNKMKKAGIKFGFGGIASIGEGMLPAEKIIMEHYRLGSSRVILSRSFCNAEKIKNIVEIQNLFKENMRRLRMYENTLSSKSDEEYYANMQTVKRCVATITNTIQEENHNDKCEYATAL